jgi:hypothetical protein
MAERITQPDVTPPEFDQHSLDGIFNRFGLIANSLFLQRTGIMNVTYDQYCATLSHAESFYLTFRQLYIQRQI